MKNNDTPKSKLEYNLFRIDEAFYSITKDGGIVKEAPTPVGFSRRVFRPPAPLKPLLKRAQEALDELPREQIAKLIEIVVKQQEAIEKSLQEPTDAIRKEDEDMPMTDEQFQILRRDLLRALTSPQKVREELEREEREELFKSMQPPEWKTLKKRREQEAENELRQKAENRKKNMDALGITEDLTRKQVTAATLTNAMLENARKSERLLDIYDVAKLYATIDRLPYQKVREALMKRLNTALSQTREGLEMWRTIKYKELTAQAETMPMGEIEQMIDKVEQQFSRR